MSRAASTTGAGSKKSQVAELLEALNQALVDHHELHRKQTSASSGDADAAVELQLPEKKCRAILIRARSIFISFKKMYFTRGNIAEAARFKREGGGDSQRPPLVEADLILSLKVALAILEGGFCPYFDSVFQFERGNALLFSFFLKGFSMLVQPDLHEMPQLEELFEKLCTAIFKFLMSSQVRAGVALFEDVVQLMVLAAATKEKQITAPFGRLRQICIGAKGSQEDPAEEAVEPLVIEVERMPQRQQCVRSCIRLVNQFIYARPEFLLRLESTSAFLQCLQSLLCAGEATWGLEATMSALGGLRHFLQCAEASGTQQTLYVTLLVVSSRWMQRPELCTSQQLWLSLGDCLLLASRSHHADNFFDLAFQPIVKNLQHVQENCLYQSKQTAPLIHATLLLYVQILRRPEHDQASDYLLLLQHPSLYSIRELHIPLADCLAAGLEACAAQNSHLLKQALDVVGGDSAGESDLVPVRQLVWLLRRCFKHTTNETSQTVSSLRPMDQRDAAWAVIVRALLQNHVELNEELLTPLKQWLESCDLANVSSTSLPADRPCKLDIAVDICLTLCAYRLDGVTAELLPAIDHILRLYDNNLATANPPSTRFLWAFSLPPSISPVIANAWDTAMNMPQGQDLRRRMFEVCMDKSDWESCTWQELPLGVLFMEDGVSYAHGLPLIERYIVLASSVRCGSSLNPGNCTRIVSAALLHPTSSVRLRAILQIPSLLANVRLTCSVVEACLEGIQDGDASMSQQWSTQSAPSAITHFHTLRGFMYKLGQWILRDREAVTLDVRICSAHTACRLTALPLAEDRDTPAQIQSGLLPRLGDIPGVLCLWELVLRAALCGKEQEASSLPTSIRVAVVRGCASLLRRQARVGALLKVDTGLVSERFSSLLARFFGLVEDVDGSVREALAAEFSVFVDGCGGGMEHGAETVGAKDEAQETIDDDAKGRGELLRAVFGHKTQTMNMKALIDRLRGLLLRHERSEQFSGTPFSHTLLRSIGTLGCTAVPRYLVMGRLALGTMLLHFALKQIVETWARCHLWYKECYERKNKPGMSVANRTMALACEQLQRIALARGFGMSARDKPKAVWLLFDSQKNYLYPLLLKLLWTEPFISVERNMLKNVIEELFGGHYGQQRFTAGKVEDLHVQRFLKGALPSLLPTLIIDREEHLLVELGKVFHKNLTTFLVDEYKPWINQVISRLIEGAREDQRTTASVIKATQGESATSSPTASMSAQTSASAAESRKIYVMLFRKHKISLLGLMDLAARDILKHYIFLLWRSDGSMKEEVIEVLNFVAKTLATMGEGLYKRKESGEAVSYSYVPQTATQGDLHPITIGLITEQFMFLTGVLTDYIVSNLESSARKCHALRCLSCMCGLLRQPDLDVHVPKVLPTLITALDGDDCAVQVEACKTMHELTKRMSTKCLGATLSAIVVALLPCLGPIEPQSEQKSDDSAEKQAVTTLRWLIVQRRAVLRGAFAEVQELMPSSHHLLRDVVAVLRKERGEVSAEERLKQLVSLVQHDSTRVQVLALEELRRLLQANMGGFLSEMDRDCPRMKRIFSDLVATLLRINGHTRGTDTAESSKVADTQGSSKVVQLCADCLGMVGAIDPSRLDDTVLQLQLQEEKEDAHELDLRSEELASHVLKHLLVPFIRASKDHATHDRIGVCIQELLRFYTGLGYADTDKSKEGEAPSRMQWIDEQTMECIRPFTKTNYEFKPKRFAGPQARKGQTCFGPGVPYGESLSNWAMFLSRHCKGAQAKIFHALQPLYARSDLTLFMLPYIIQNALCNAQGEDAAAVESEIKKEVLGVLLDKFSSGPLQRGNLESPIKQNAQLGKRKRGEEEAQRVENAESFEAARAELSVQAMFYVLDTLSSWVLRWSVIMASQRVMRGPSASLSVQEHATNAGNDSAAYQGEFIDKSAVQRFLKSIPAITLTQAALACGSYPRALKYLEQHLRDSHAYPYPGITRGSWRPDQPVQFERSEIELLHQLYATFDASELDGLAGISTLRSRHDGGESTGVKLGRIQPKVKAEGEDRGGNVSFGELTGEPTLVEQIHELESKSRWYEALVCYEQALREFKVTANGPRLQREELLLHKGHLDCIRHTGNYEMLMRVAQGKTLEQEELKPLAFPYHAEALCRLGDWKELEQVVSGGAGVVKQDSAARYIEAFSKALLKLVEMQAMLKRGGAGKEVLDTVEGGFHQHIQRAQRETMALLSAASMDSYYRTYPLLLRLHVLSEIKSGWKVVRESLQGTEGCDPALELKWDVRRHLTTPHLAIREELFHGRKPIYILSGLAHAEVKEWLAIARVARDNGQVQSCLGSLLKLKERARRYFADNQGSNNEDVEALVCWAKIERAKLLEEMDKGSAWMEPADVRVDGLVKRLKGASDVLKRAKAELLLYATNRIAETGQLQGRDILRRYKAVLLIQPKWEEGFFHLGKYYDLLFERLVDSAGDQEATSDDLDTDRLVPAILKQYGDSLKWTSYNHIYESLPRLLTLWFSYGEKLHSQQPDKPKPKGSSRNSKKSKAQAAANPLLEKINKVMTDLVRELAPHIWYTALPQLVSRLMHPTPEIWELTKQILVRIITAFPSQALWYIMGVALSKVAFRRERAQEVLKETVRQTKQLEKRVAQSKNIFEAFVKLALHLPPRHDKEMNIFKVVGGSRQIKAKLEESQLTMPINSALTVTLPTQSNEEAKDYCAFSKQAVVLHKLGERALLMNSKERPKKISVVGSDGVSRNFLCKNEHRGDLRKDSRLMEFNTVVNRLFQKDSQARRRKLRLRTYAVVCLNEECGLLEWVENTEGFRSCIQQVYAQQGQNISLRSGLKTYRVLLENLQKDRKHTAEQKLRMYRQRVLQAFPPMFHYWFLNRFSDPSRWLNARTLFTRSAAVWSMVGHIVGLGDRHAENLLLDVTCGECVHVDFDCIFDKGLDLGVPEIVPFRLTPHMVDGMDISGVDGAFKSTCVIALDVLRENKDILLSVLQSFENDPLVEWARVKQNQGTKQAAVQGKAEGQDRLKDIKERLEGIVRDRNSVAASRKNKTKQSFANNVFDVMIKSTQGQVQQLIEEAIDEKNLFQMFSGWAPFL